MVRHTIQQLQSSSCLALVPTQGHHNVLAVANMVTARAILVAQRGQMIGTLAHLNDFLERPRKVARKGLTVLILNGRVTAFVFSGETQENALEGLHALFNTRPNRVVVVKEKSRKSSLLKLSERR
tara:strand:- start:368 stop:742 length:375 start_codon:yes stop_codon:yes gene_type:complete